MGHMGNRRSVPISDEQIADMYRDCLSAKKISRETGLNEKTVYNALRRLGVKTVGLEHYRRNATRFTPEQEMEIRKRYEAGAYFAQLVEEFGGTEYSIKHAIKRAGGTLGKVTPPLSEDEIERIVLLRKEGLSHAKIAAQIGRSLSTITRFFRLRGDFASNTHGERHPGWKGGRMKVNGYWRVLVRPDDPLVEMRNRDGYALEHRLVMARYLGRPLSKTETVHHINGDKSDNRIENLQLRQGRHGKHSVYVCCDCGSHNVKPVRLKA